MINELYHKILKLSKCREKKLKKLIKKPCLNAESTIQKPCFFMKALFTHVGFSFSPVGNSLVKENIFG
jgi:hypothetical protein